MMYWQYLTEKPGDGGQSSDLESMSNEEFLRRREESMKQQYGDG